MQYAPLVHMSVQCSCDTTYRYQLDGKRLRDCYNMANSVKFIPKLKELRIHLCPRSETSKGVRDFLNKSYVPLKKANPKFPILVRECSGVEPKLWARYEFGKETVVDLSNITAEDVLGKIGSVNKC